MPPAPEKKERQLAVARDKRGFGARQKSLRASPEAASNSRGYLRARLGCHPSHEQLCIEQHERIAASQRRRGGFHQRTSVPRRRYLTCVRPPHAHRRQPHKTKKYRLGWLCRSPKSTASPGALLKLPDKRCVGSYVDQKNQQVGSRPTRLGAMALMGANVT